MKNKLIVFSIPLLASSAGAQTWTLESSFKEVAGQQDSVSELTFSSGSKKILYLPTEAPFGLVFEEKFTLAGKDYFVTGWAQGAATVLFRVFAPASNGEKPLCQISSFAEEAKLKLVKDQIEISVIPKLKAKSSWVHCAKKQP